MLHTGRRALHQDVVEELRWWPTPRHQSAVSPPRLAAPPPPTPFPSPWDVTRKGQRGRGTLATAGASRLRRCACAGERRRERTCQKWASSRRAASPSRRSTRPRRRCVLLHRRVRACAACVDSAVYGLGGTTQEEQPALDRDIRLEFARPHWEALSKAERHALLRLSLSDLGVKAAGADVGACHRHAACVGARQPRRHWNARFGRTPRAGAPLPATCACCKACRARDTRLRRVGGPVRVKTAPHVLTLRTGHWRLKSDSPSPRLP